MFNIIRVPQPMYPISAEGRGVQCPNCEKRCKNKAGLKSHSRVHKKMVSSYACCHCSKICKTQWGLKRHALVHSVNKLTCDDCNKTFLTLNKYDDHMNVHNRIYPFVCQTCGQFFDTENTFDKHCNSHRVTHVFFCALCFRGFTSKQSLSKHIAKHQNPVPKHCRYCLRTFTTDRQRWSHEEIHEKEVMKKRRMLEEKRMEEERKEEERLEKEKMEGQQGLDNSGGHEVKDEESDATPNFPTTTNEGTMAAHSTQTHVLVATPQCPEPNDMEIKKEEHISPFFFM